MEELTRKILEKRVPELKAALAASNGIEDKPLPTPPEKKKQKSSD
ncbi:MAG TPA: hypothetical protein PKA06_06875 [Gemmatales bacterium]|nr:hypothetical protein [Gemmatales bacterium]